MSTVEMVPFVTNPRCFQVKVEGEWIASVHHHPSGLHVHMFWSEFNHPDSQVHHLQGGLPAAYQWAMQMHRKYPEWNRPGR